MVIKTYFEDKQQDNILKNLTEGNIKNSFFSFILRRELIVIILKSVENYHYN